MSDQSAFKQLQHHDPYYLNGGDLHLLVDNFIFRVHRYFFERESPIFKDQLTRPAAPGCSPRGTSDSNTIVLTDIKAAEFEKLLWVFYNPTYSLYDTTVEDWICILDLAQRWLFGEVKKLAIRELEKKDIQTIDRIVLYQKYQADDTLLIPLYAELCARDLPLDFDEADRLGMKATVLLYRARERMRANPNDGGRSPLPRDLQRSDVHLIIKELFAAPASPSHVSTGKSAETSTQGGSQLALPKPAPKVEAVVKETQQAGVPAGMPARADAELMAGADSVEAFGRADDEEEDHDNEQGTTDNMYIPRAGAKNPSDSAEKVGESGQEAIVDAEAIAQVAPEGKVIDDEDEGLVDDSAGRSKEADEDDRLGLDYEVDGSEDEEHYWDSPEYPHSPDAPNSWI